MSFSQGNVQSTRNEMTPSVIDFIGRADAAGAVESINEQLKTAVVDGNLEALPTLYTQRAVWRMQLGLPAKAEADLVAAQRCPLSNEAQAEVQLLLVQCYRTLDRADDAAQAAAALRESVLRPGAALSAVMLQQVLACLHGPAARENGKSNDSHSQHTATSVETAAVRTTDREGSKQAERKKSGMMSGFLASAATRNSKKASQEAKSVSVAPSIREREPVHSSVTSLVEDGHSGQAKAIKTTVHGNTVIEEVIDDEEPSRRLHVGNESEPRQLQITGSDACELDDILSRDPKYFSSMSRDDQERLAEVMGASGTHSSSNSPGAQPADSDGGQLCRPLPEWPRAPPDFGAQRDDRQVHYPD
jgi:hypothetical protein